MKATNDWKCSLDHCFVSLSLSSIGQSTHTPLLQVCSRTYFSPFYRPYNFMRSVWERTADVRILHERLIAAVVTLMMFSSERIVTWTVHGKVRDVWSSIRRQKKKFQGQIFFFFSDFHLSVHLKRKASANTAINETLCTYYSMFWQLLSIKNTWKYLWNYALKTYRHFKVYFRKRSLLTEKNLHRFSIVCFSFNESYFCDHHR